MKKIGISSVLICCIHFLFAQNLTDSGTFLLHKFEQKIGKEKYIIHKENNNINYDVDFKYVDRGSPVNLTSTIRLTASLEPLYFRIKGGTSRFSTVNDSVVINNNTAVIKVDDSLFTKTLSGINFPVAGYSPAVAQMLLIQYWKKHNQPVSINMLPYGTVSINKDGDDAFSFNGKTLNLERYVLKGLIWGNELLWTDEKGQLICLITNDAEGDKQEMTFEPYETLLPEIISKAGEYGMRLFTKTAKPSFQKHNKIAITNGTLIDVVNNNSIPGTTILIENEKVKQTGNTGSVKIPSDAFVIDAKGKAILPGFHIVIRLPWTAYCF